MEVLVDRRSAPIVTEPPISYDPPATFWVKRVFDVIVAGLLLLVLSPLALCIAVAIRLESRGPVFFVQHRLGRDGRIFRMIKFRSMHLDAAARLEAILAEDPVLRAEYEAFHKMRRDPRVTRVGRLLRKFSLDELPQLLNVFTGQMSLVGPRPYLPEELRKMHGRHPVILGVPPGITGLWQTSGRNELPFQKRLDLDAEYALTWSFWRDLSMLVRTVPVVVTGRGAC